MPKGSPRSWLDRRRRLLLVGDEDLIACVEAGNPHAFAVLYDRHSRAAFSLAYRMMGEKRETEDLVQEAFIKVWRGAGSYRAERGSVRTWVLSVVHNRGIDRLRAHATRRRAQDRIEAIVPRSQPSEAFDESWRSTLRDRLREALATLPQEQHEVLVLAHFSGLTHAEIAERLHLPLGTVKGRMRLGLEKLRNRFEGMAVG